MMRVEIGGCVENRLSTLEEIIIACRLVLTPGITSLPEIFCNAEINASGFLVNSIAPASAMNSRALEMANLIINENRCVNARNRIAMASEISTETMAPLPSLSRPPRLRP